MSLYAQEVVSLTAVFSTSKSTLKGKYDFRYITANFVCQKAIVLYKLPQTQNFAAKDLNQKP